MFAVCSFWLYMKEREETQKKKKEKKGANILPYTQILKKYLGF